MERRFKECQYKNCICESRKLKKINNDYYNRHLHSQCYKELRQLETHYEMMLNNCSPDCVEPIQNTLDDIKYMLNPYNYFPRKEV